MAHDFPLHTDIEVRCLCCQSLQRFRFASASDQVVCVHCRNHLGTDKAERRDREHVALWRSLSDAANEEHAASAAEAAASAAESVETIAALRAEVARLAAGIIDEFDATRSGGMRQELQNDLVKRAERATELANRRIDRIMAGLWRLEAFHHPDARKPGFCSCGRTSASCGENRILEGQRQEMRDWEAKNLRLLRAGQRHGLPDEHPEVAAQQPTRR